MKGKTMKRMRFVVVIAAAALFVPMSAFAFSGTLLSSTGGILGTGNWGAGSMSLEWEVTQNVDLSWTYRYVFSHPLGATSHFILETSPSFTDNDLFGPTVGFGPTEIKFHEVTSGNPSMPEGVYGIKFEGVDGTVTTLEFNSYRSPIWGDFYSKDGVVSPTSQRPGSQTFNTAWNAGFTTADFDPTAPAANGAYMNHLLVPDTDTPPIPEPSTMLLLGSGLLGAVAVIRRRR